MTTSTAALRTAAMCLLTLDQAKPATTWRLVLTDTESLTGVGLVCTDPAHPGIDDVGCEYDEMGVYDCCPLVIETWHEKVAAYLAALLNGDDERDAKVRVAALAEAADTMQQAIDAKWAGPDREGQRRLWLYPLVDLVRRLAMPH
jgi:hypothetical protein